jgi:hypothetical protein
VPRTVSCRYTGEGVASHNINLSIIRGCIQKFPPDWVITKYTLTTINTRREATQRVMAAKLVRLTHKIAIQQQLVAESFTICSSCSRRPVQKLLITPSNVGEWSASRATDTWWIAVGWAPELIWSWWWKLKSLPPPQIVTTIFKITANHFTVVYTPVLDSWGLGLENVSGLPDPDKFFYGFLRLW